MITDVGITASRHGLSETQRRILTAFLHRARLAGAARFHHGKCVGGDETGAQIARNMGYRTIAHPPLCDQWESTFTSHESREPLPYLVRDRNIIAAVDVLIGLPNRPECTGSGTWYTIRHARRVGRRRLVVLPSGMIAKDQHGLEDRVGVDDLHLVTAGEYAAGPVITDSEITEREEAS